MNKPKLTLKPMPDGLGFLYGELVCGDDVYRVDIMPPEAEWCGDVRMKDHGPHPIDWVIYLNGKEIARVRARNDLETAISKALARS